MNAHEKGAKTPDTSGAADAMATGPQSLEAAMASLRGHAAYATLGQIHQVAMEKFGFGQSQEIALAYLTQLPDVRVEVADSLDESQVFAPAYWKP